MIFPVFNESSLLAGRIQDLISFWKRFPVEVEVVLVIDHISEGELAELRTQIQNRNQETQIQFQILTQKKRTSRGSSVWRGLQKATGDILAVGSIDYSIPLGEFFSALQEFILTPQESFLVLGNRRGKKKKRQGSKSGLRSFFENVEHDKSRTLEVEDPTSPFWLIRKSDWASLKVEKMRSWFYTPAILQKARQRGLLIREIEVQTQDRPETNFRWRDAWR